MTEGNKIPVITSAEELAAIITDGVVVDVGGKGFKIRPLSVKEEGGIDKAVTGLKDNDNPSLAASDIAQARERMRLIISKGLLEPQLGREQIENLPSGMFYLLATAIDNLSSYQSKKELTSS